MYFVSRWHICLNSKSYILYNQESWMCWNISQIAFANVSIQWQSLQFSSTFILFRGELKLGWHFHKIGLFHPQAINVNQRKCHCVADSWYLHQSNNSCVTWH